MLSFNEYKIEGQWVQLKDKGIIANKDFWSPPSPSPPIRLILQKIGKIQKQFRMARNGEKLKKKLPLGDPPPKKKLRKIFIFFQIFFESCLELSET